MKTQCVLFLLFVFGHFTSLGQSVVTIPNDRDDIVLNPSAYTFNNQNAGLKDIARVINGLESEFTKNSYFQEINYGFHHPRGWCKFTINNISDNSSWILKIHQGRVDSAQLFAVRKNDQRESFQLTGHFQSIVQRPYHSITFAYPITIQPGETVTFYLYTQREFGRHATILNLQKENFFKDYEHKFIVSISFICGMTMLATLIGLVLYFFIWDRIYLYYSIYCLIFFILILADSGFVHAYISDPSYQSVINTFNTIFYYWIVGWHLLFILVLLNIRSQEYGWIYWLGYYSGLLFCLAAVILMFLPMLEGIRWWVIYFSYFIVFFADIYILYMLVISLARKEPAVFFYLAGFVVTLTIASVLMLADLQLVDGINQNVDIYYFIPLIEILFMVLGLGFRFSHTVKERFRVQFALNKTQNQIITIQEDERKRIAQDLHDDVGNSLAAIKHMLSQKRENTVIEKEIDKIIEDIRSISHNLMPVDFKEYPLTSIVGHAVNKLHNHPSINFEYNYIGEVIKIDPIKELVIYRIINELINNVIKHSKASTALIQLIYQKDSLVMMVEDNGIGMEKTQTGKGDGLGLKSIQLRAEYINARLNVESDNKGTLIILEIPYEHSFINTH